VNLQASTERAADGLARFGQRHHGGIVAAAVALLAGFGITAVATVAVSPLLPEAAELPRRIVSQPLEPQGLAAQLDALAAQDITLTRSDVTRATDTPEKLLARLGVVDPSAASFLRLDSTARLLLAGRGGKMVQAHTEADGTLRELAGRFPAERPEQARTHFTRLTMSRIGGRWLARLQTVPYGTQMRLASGTVRTSLFAATDEAGIPDSVAAQIADIFATDIDFHRELKKGDTFHLVYESLSADGEPVFWNEGAGRVLAAEFINGRRQHQALWFEAGDGRGAYFSPDGRSKRRSFLASPMEFSRVTSGFAMRMHPILNSWRKHNGVDYAAPKGTPVRSVGEGFVEFAGWQNGYGNVVEIRHANEQTTLYAHLSRLDARKGQRVEQGQHIGAVGATGWATGPHLHFEFRVGGAHKDPLAIAKAAETVALDAASRPRFAQALAAVQAKLDVAQTLSGTRGQAE
jgi:murein DD-endopeptidase MepM/ murein hydrolase activator NlpD